MVGASEGRVTSDSEHFLLELVAQVQHLLPGAAGVGSFVVTGVCIIGPIGIGEVQMTTPHYRTKS